MLRWSKNHTCNTALTSLVDKWLGNIDKLGKVNGAIFLFYLRKAFDIVDHIILISKLDTYKFDQMSSNLVKSENNVSLTAKFDVQLNVTETVLLKALYWVQFYVFYLWMTFLYL